MNNYIKTLVAERKEEILVKAEEARIKAYERMIKSPVFEEKVMRQETLSTLDALLVNIQDAYEDRKLIRTFGFGVLLDKVFTLAGSLVYAPEDEKEVLLLACSTDSVLIEDLISSLGRTSYYDSKENIIVESTIYNLKDIHRCTEEFVLDLGLPRMSTEHITEAFMDRRLSKASAKAKMNQLLAQEQLSLMSEM